MFTIYTYNTYIGGKKLDLKIENEQMLELGNDIEHGGHLWSLK